MLRYIEHKNCCYIVIDKAFQEDDIPTLEMLFEKHYEHYEVKIVSLYTLNASLVKLLGYYQPLRNLSLVTDRMRVSRYLHSLGIETMLHFDERLERAFINVDADVILIGGSAKSSKHILAILGAIDITKYIVVIIQHIGTQTKHSFDTLIAENLGLHVSYAKDAEAFEKGKVYLAPAGKHLLVKDGMALLEESQEVHGAKPSISVAFKSFGTYYKERLCVVLECGYTDDGVDALEDLYDLKSCVVIHKPSECGDASTMPCEAVATKKFHYLLDTQEMVDFFSILSEKYTKENLVKYFLKKVYEIYEYNYEEYDANMLKRRIELFEIKYSIEDRRLFVLLVLYNKVFFKLFFLEVSINVSEFFRSPSDLKNLMEVLVPFKNNYNIKIWSAGVSNGKEAYSLAMLLEGASLLEKTLIYATDFNPVVLNEAKNALYGISEYSKAKDNVQKLHSALSLDDYFIQHNGFVEVDERIKKRVMFFVHNLQSDSSFNEFDVIVCRNVLIYFTPELQKKVFQLFYDSLKFGGYLLLGADEFLLSDFEEQFYLCSSESKLYKKVK